MTILSLEALIYRIKVRFPGLFSLIEKTARVLVYLRFGNRTSRACKAAPLHGVIQGKPAEIRPLKVSDSTTLNQFLGTIPEAHLTYFQPHGFSETELKQTISSKAFLTYGLFVNEEIIGYALLKISPTGTAYIGLLVSPHWTGYGLGRFIVSYLYWQASVAKLRARSTISRDNTASLKSHQAVADYKVVAELPNNYLMIEFPETEQSAPFLNL